MTEHRKTLECWLYEHLKTWYKYLPLLTRFPKTIVPSNPVPDILQHTHYKQSTTQTNAETTLSERAARTPRTPNCCQQRCADIVFVFARLNADSTSSCNHPTLCIRQLHTICNATQSTRRGIQSPRIVAQTPLLVRPPAEVLIYYYFGLLNPTHRQTNTVLAHPWVFN